MSFFLLIVLIGAAASLFTAGCLYSKSMSTAKKIWIFAAVLFAWFAAFFPRLLERGDWLNPTAAGWIHNIGYYLFGTAFFFFRFAVAQYRLVRRLRNRLLVEKTVCATD